MIKNLSKVLLLIVILSPISFSQDVIRLTLDQAVSMALENSWDIKLARKEEDKADQQIKEAYSNAFPRIALDAMYTRNLKLPVLFIAPNTPINPSDQTAKFELGSKNSFSTGLTLTQVLYNQKVNTAIQIADDYAELSRIGTQSTSKDIILSVKSAFYGVLFMQELVKVSKLSNETAKAHFENTSALYKQGVASEFDYLRADVEAANTLPAVISSENALENAKNGLKTLLNIDVNQQVEVVGDLQFEETILDSLETEDAISLNPLFRQLNLQESLLDKNITIQQSDFFPTLALFGSYQWQSQDNTFRVKDWMWANTIAVGLQISYTLFDGFGRSARVEMARIEKEKVTLNRNKLEDGLKLQIRSAQLSVAEAKKRIEAQERNITQAEKAMKISETRYRSGVGTQLEMMDTQTALTATRTNYAQALYDYLVAKANWEYVISKEVSYKN